MQRIKRHDHPAGRTLAIAAALALLHATAAFAADPPTGVDPEAVKNLEKAYPPAPAGMERKVILLPHKERGAEDDFRVEIVVGKTIVTDGINTYGLAGDLREVDIAGWGFSYWQAEGSFDAPVQTRIGGPATPTPAFVAGPSRLVRYNSRLPLVVMVPEGCEVRWRTWKAAEGFTPAESR
ncbi:MAG: ecotin family protein [Planctomycetaceae bacterium]